MSSLLSHTSAPSSESEVRLQKLDLIAANEVGDDKVFEKDDNALLVLWRDGRRDLGPGRKTAVAQDLMGLIAERFAAVGPAVAAAGADSRK